jgi:hypothetical protein
MSKEHKLKIYPMRDATEGFHKKKGELFDLPFRIGIIGKSQMAGKTTLISSLLARKEFYHGDIKPENIIIVSPSAKSDQKWKLLIKFLDIPSENVYTKYNEDQLNDLYAIIQEEYEEAVEEKKKPEHWCIVFDDVGYTNVLKNKQGGFIDRLFSNGRHFLISTCVILQKYTTLSTTARENLTGLMCFSCSNKQLEQIMDDHLTSTSKKQFREVFRDATNEPHSFFTINYTNPYDKRFAKRFEDYYKM